MTQQNAITVTLDDRVRLLSAILALTDYPEQRHKLKPHGTHAHARATRKQFASFNTHPAVQTVQNLLNQSTPLEALYGLVTGMEWPNLSIHSLPGWVPTDFNSQLYDFLMSAKLEEWWEKERSAWNKSLREANNVFSGADFKPFFKPFLGEITEAFTFIPNISYPTDYDIGFRQGTQLICISPPPLAWGDSPPWPYDEATMITFSLRSAMIVYGRLLLKNYLDQHESAMPEIVKNELPVSDQFRAQHPSWIDQFSELFLTATVAMYLEDRVDEKEYKAYMLMEQKTRGMNMLPGTVSVLRRYLQEVGNTKYNNLIEFLPFFPKQLRVARKIVTF